MFVFVFVFVVWLFGCVFVGVFVVAFVCLPGQEEKKKKRKIKTKSLSHTYERGAARVSSRGGRLNHEEVGRFAEAKKTPAFVSIVRCFGCLIVFTHFQIQVT